MAEIRLQKLLAERGVAARREAEKLIAAGRVAVDGHTVREMGLKVDEQTAAITIDGQPLPQPPKLRYILLHKPVGYICAAKDERGKPSVLHLLGDIEERVYPVGRLDYDTSGLLLLSNDGAFTQLLSHPSHQVEKLYLAELRGPISPGDMDKLRRGVLLEDGLTAPAQVHLKRRGKTSSQIEIIIHEGRKRQVKRMCQAVGHPVIRLQRLRVGNLSLGKLRAGQWRELTPQEVRKLKQEGKHEPKPRRGNR